MILKNHRHGARVSPWRAGARSGTAAGDGEMQVKCRLPTAGAAGAAAPSGWGGAGSGLRSPAGSAARSAGPAGLFPLTARAFFGVVRDRCGVLSLWSSFGVA
jgi:hypothetical protein